uniref:Methionine--tRNA ligase, mitochondrial n=1 Tax=Plectus sambesii TaxID=2011161 RepID=A0A914WSW5_9BILA
MVLKYLKRLQYLALQDIAAQMARPMKGMTGAVMCGVLARRNELLEKKAAELLDIQADQKILEIGYGPGVGIQSAYERVKGGSGHIFGVERSLYMHNRARKKFALEIAEDKNIHFECADVVHMPFPNDFFDGIFHCNCYYYWPDMHRATFEIFRILKPGGKIVATLNLDRLQRSIKQGLMRYGNPDPVRYMSALEDAGFRDVSIEYFPDKQKPEYQAIFGKKRIEDTLLNAEERMAALEEEMLEWTRHQKMLKTGRPISDEEKWSDSESREKITTKSIRLWRQMRSPLYPFRIWRRYHSFVTTPIFYVNAAPHIGHLYSALLADAAHRWTKISKKNSDCPLIFSTGTDEHGVKIQNAAEAAKKNPKQFCDEISGRFRSVLIDHCGVAPTDFIRTTEQRHRVAVETVWNKLADKGYIYKDSYAGWYSVVDECFYSEKDVEEVTDANGNVVKVSKTTKSVLQWVEEENYMFRLSKLHDRLRKWLLDSDVIQPKHYLPHVLQALRPGEDLSISRDRSRLQWGIAVPNDPTQTVYVWLDALTNYLTVAGYPAKMSQWPPDCQVIGKDILKFHAIYWPAFLMALEVDVPKKLYIHAHWLIDGVKMSKSVGNVIDPVSASEVLTVEGLRYFLLRQGVPHDDGDFTFIKAINVLNAELSNNIGNLVSRGTVDKLNPRQTYPKFDKKFFESDLKELGQSLIQNLDKLNGVVTNCFDNMQVHKAVDAICSVARQGNGFFQFYKPWTMTNEMERDTVLFVTCEKQRTATELAPLVANAEILPPNSNIYSLRFAALKVLCQNYQNLIYGTNPQSAGTIRFLSEVADALTLC